MVMVQMDFDDEDCADAFDTQEEAASTYCSDGSDNDGDGWTDVEDLDCMTGDEESGFSITACNDSVDNDGDGTIDSEDFGCASSLDNNEDAGQCEDGLDNDADGWVDSEDPACAVVET